jgi:hypothetical protein
MNYEIIYNNNNFFIDFKKTFNLKKFLFTETH